MLLSQEADMFLRAAQEHIDNSGRVRHEVVARFCRFEGNEYYFILDELERNGYIEFDYMGLGRNYRYHYLKTFVLTEKGYEY